jgi:hypothetical protein
VVVFQEILDGQKDGAESVLNDILAHLAGSGNGHGVSVDHAEALLVNGALGLGVHNLLFAVVTDGEGLEVLVNNEARSAQISLKNKNLLEVMNMLSLHPLSINIVFEADLALADLGQLSINIESKGTKLTDVNGVTRAKGVVEVSNETSPDDQHLIKRI